MKPTSAIFPCGPKNAASAMAPIAGKNSRPVVMLRLR